MPTTYTFTTSSGSNVSVPVYSESDMYSYVAQWSSNSMPRYPSENDMDTFFDWMYEAWKKIRKDSKDVYKYKSIISNIKNILNCKRSVVEKLILCKMAIEWEPVFLYTSGINNKIPEDKFKDYLNSDVKLDEH